MEVSKYIKRKWREATWTPYTKGYTVTVVSAGQEKHYTRFAARYRRLQGLDGRAKGPSLRQWARQSSDPAVRAWAERKGLQK